MPRAGDREPGGVPRIEALWLSCAAAVLLLALGIQQAGSIRDESATWDEPMELAAGYSYWLTGDYRLNRDNPPLHKLAAAAPLLLLDLNLPLEDPSWRQGDQVVFGRRFLFENRISSERMLLLSRIPSMLATAALVLAVLFLGRRLVGSAAAVAAAWLVAFDPNIIAHGRYVKNDVWLSLTVLLACAAWIRYLEKRTNAAAAAAGITLGVALATKHTALFLIPAWMASLILAHWFTGSRRNLITETLRFGAVAAVAYAVLLAFYPSQIRLASPMTHAMGMNKDPHAEMRNSAAGGLIRIGAKLGLTAHPYWAGAADVAAHSHAGHPAYLLGSISHQARWSYFPVAFAVKTPVGTLVVVAAAMAAALWRAARHLRNRGAAPPVSKTPARSLSFCVFGSWIVIYLAFVMNSGINIGIRHLLPIVPPLYLCSMGVLGSAADWLARDNAALGRRARAAVAGMLILAAAETASAYPYYLPFFNWPAGGRAEGHRYLLDSNLDWGQEMVRLAGYARQRPGVCVCLAQFGNTPASTLGIRELPVPTREEWQAGKGRDCLIAVSATFLYGLYAGADRFAWLRERQPKTVLGSSMYIYDFRPPPAQ